MSKIKAAGLIAALSLVLLLMLELGVRVFAPQQTDTWLLTGVPLVVEDAVLGHRNRPGAVVLQQDPEFSAHYVIDERGLRGPSLRAHARRPGYRRLVLLGDSFTFGTGSDYAATWPAVLERTLNAQGYRVEVLNAGVPGYDTRSAVRYLERLWPRLEPDVVVLSLLPNDVFINRPLSEPVAAAPAVTPRGAGAPALQVVTLLQRLLLRHDWLYVQTYRRSARAAFFAPSAAQATPAVQQQFETTKALLRRASAFCRERQVPLFVFSLPQQFQVLAEAHRYQIQRLDVHAVDRALARIAEQAGLPWLSALDTLAAAYRAQRVPLYYRLDGHLTPQGNQVVGRYAAGYLADFLRPVSPQP